MEVIITIATLLGGLSALWFFWDKVKSIFIRIFSNRTDPENILAISDDEFAMLEKILKSKAKKSYLPISDSELSLCKALVNQGWLNQKSDFTFTLTRKALKHYA
ncbi:hypothetical protein [Pseudomonas borbori]|uniref:hypothetical protein n=1 Tax=Pseudomonas borbori TaxID=289003 RepID=UPI001130992B|nr:hypothetical protein [Pseudomonas borbori]